jgi:hypothetical protein
MEAVLHVFQKINNRSHLLPVLYSIYIVADDTHSTQKINTRSLLPFSKDTRIYVFPIINNEHTY